MFSEEFCELLPLVYGDFDVVVTDSPPDKFSYGNEHPDVESLADV